MNKVATYLNEHLAGEALSDIATLKRLATDQGVLYRQPELIVNAANISDVRKVMRFCSQLAEKGHVMPVAVRGNSTDTTGGGVTNGIAINLSKYMQRVIGIDPKQQLIHVQAGMSVSAINATLSTHKGLGLPSISYTGEDGTIGGAISTAPSGITAGTHGLLANNIDQMEVILSNGDVIQTGRISRRELSKKKGLATFEGEIYRALDNLISDNTDLIAQLDVDAPETAGFGQIAKVKHEDGSFDLTPLFCGSQGSLGVICEIIMKARFISPNVTVVIAQYGNISEALRAIDIMTNSKASGVEFIDGRIMQNATKAGKKHEWASPESFNGGIAMAIFDDFSDHARAKLVKKLNKKLDKTDSLSISELNLENHELSSLHSFLTVAHQPSTTGLVSPQIFSGIWLPNHQITNFNNSLKKMEEKYQIELPLFVDYSSNYIDIVAKFDSKKVSDRQKVLHLLAEISSEVDSLGGSFAGFGGDGKLKSSFVRKNFSNEEKQLYDKIKQIFDPMKLLCPNVKSDISTKDLASEFNAWCKNHTQA